MNEGPQYTVPYIVLFQFRETATVLWKLPCSVAALFGTNLVRQPGFSLGKAFFTFSIVVLKEFYEPKRFQEFSQPTEEHVAINTFFSLFSYNKELLFMIYPDKLRKKH